MTEKAMNRGFERGIVVDRDMEMGGERKVKRWVVKKMNGERKG